jgi:VCBS repeat-containing protein
MANDGQLNSNVATVTITVTPVNHAPVAANDSYGVSKNNALTVAAPGVLANDTDVDGDPLTAILVSGPAHGTLALSANGSFTYTPAAGYTGGDSFTYKANDGQLDSNVATVALTVSDDAPVANADSYAVSKNNALTVAAPGVLANDTDANGDALTAALVSGPAHGTLALNANGSFTYTPAAGYTGADSFMYKANDGQLDSNVATVALTVSDDAPVANADSYSVSKNNALTVSAPGVLANDTDANGDALTAALVSGPAHGTLTLSANGSFTYTPAAGYTGGDSFTYKANDGQLDSNVATVALTVSDDAPVANADSYGVSKNNPLTISAPGVLGNDTDANGDALTAALVAGPAHGTLALSANGSFSYTPAAGYTGGDSFTYKANDGQLDSNSATVSLTVSDDAPVAANDSYAVSKNNALTVAAPGVLGNDTDANGDTLAAVLVSGPAHGTLTLSANGSFTYMPASGYTGGDSFTYKANDGQLDSNVATVALSVHDDAPVAASDSYAVSKNNPLTVSAPGVLANDTDANGDALTAILVSGPAHGTLTLSANGSLTYTPASGYTGGDSFTYKANDGQLDSNVATVALTVSDTAPVAANDSYSANKNSSLTVSAPGVLGNDTDANGDTLTAVLVSGPAHGTVTLNANGSFTYTPKSGYTGADSFTYKANDGQLDSNVATVALTVRNRPPLAANVSYSTSQGSPLTVSAPGVLASATDPDADPLTAALVSGPANGSLQLNADGSFTYTPGFGFAGTDTFTYRASDGTDFSNPATVIITVVPANTPGVTIQTDPGNPNGLALVVRGTSGNDNIDIKSTGNTNLIQVTIRSDDFHFNGVYPATFTRLIVYGLAGDDNISVANNVTLPALLFGGDGNDHLQAGGGPTVLVGGDGDDHLQGGLAPCVLIGGRGSDHLEAGSGGSILIAGYTDLDANARALCAVLDEWASAQSYAARAAWLGGVLNSATVHDDGVQNQVNGGQGMDWFLVNTKRDKVNGVRAGEVVTDTSSW